MKKLIVALTALTAFTGSASAADLAARPYTKAPMMAPAHNLTGFFIFCGGGRGLFSADSNVRTSPGGLALTRDQRLGGDGWFGTVGVGYDWQFGGNWVAGIFGDGQFGEIRGSLSDSNFVTEGREKLRTSYAAGARIGYLVAPQVLSYVNGGYSGSQWSGTTQSFLTPPPGNFTTTGSFHRNGWFLGGGVENNLDIFGITAPGWFMKTEYRSAFYDRKSVNELFDVTNLPVGRDVRFNNCSQTISTSLVYRFNWGGPVVAKY